MEYLVPFLLALTGMFLAPRFQSEAPKRILVVVILLYMILLMGFRYRVGMDTMIYMKKMEQIPPINVLLRQNILDQVYEPAYLIICSVCKYFTKEFWPIQMVMNAIMTTCVFIFLYRSCKNVFTGIFVFLLLQWLYYSTEIMRESVAISIFLLNYKNLEEKKWIRYYLFSLFSISFHYSAALVWFLPFVRFLKPNFAYILFCIGMLAITPIVEEFNKLINIGIVTQKLRYYVDQAEILNMNWRIAEMIKTGFPAILALVMYRYSHLENKYTHLVLLQFLFCCGAFAVPVIFQRFSNYTSVFVTVSLANYIGTRSVGVNLRAVVLGAILMSQTIYYYSMWPTWYPYVSVFEPEKNPAREEFFRIVW